MVANKYRKILLLMAEVVFEVLALGFERVVILVLDLPTCSARSGNRHDIVVSDVMGRGPGLAEHHVALGIRGDEFAPINPQGIIAVAQGRLIDLTVVSVNDFVLIRRERTTVGTQPFRAKSPHSYKSE